MVTATGSLGIQKKGKMLYSAQPKGSTKNKFMEVTLNVKSTILKSKKHQGVRYQS